MCNRRFGVSVNLEKNGQERTDINDEKGVLFTVRSYLQGSAPSPL